MIDHLKLTGKVALVQGGSRGIGAAIVNRLAKEGAAVAFTYVNSEVNALEIQDSINANGGRALAIRADSADEKAIRQAVQTTAETLGRLDILVNNAGVLAIAPLNEFSMQDFDKTLAINVRSVFIASQEAARHMEEGGRIINIGSTNAERMPFAGGATYAMSKSALIGLTKGMARDLGPQGITVNNVQPGPVDTDMNPEHGEFAESLKALMALPRYGKSEEIASFVAYLAGPEAGYITGASLTIDGVRVVIDAGLARVPRFDPGSGMTRLETQRISRASATQRAGRAGRLEPGVCYRLWSEAQHDQLAAYGAAEILQADLAGLALQLARWGVTPAQLVWLDV
ncbi:SDR family oxidoreductase, partial [Pseudomonas syringae pv. actinidiae]|nr:SDR family oxidoreductase [Pseudomonas syringae pv. actinidiae]